MLIYLIFFFWWWWWFLKRKKKAVFTFILFVSVLIRMKENRSVNAITPYEGARLFFFFFCPRIYVDFLYDAHRAQPLLPFFFRNYIDCTIPQLGCLRTGASKTVFKIKKNKHLSKILKNNSSVNKFPAPSLQRKLSLSLSLSFSVQSLVPHRHSSSSHSCFFRIISALFFCIGSSPLLMQWAGLQGVRKRTGELWRV